jgi:V8-like Glu-specific endopeptidase
MPARLASLTGLFILLFSSHQVFARRASVIYGDDNRTDYYAETDARLRSLSASTVALLRESALTNAGAVTNIATVPYGSQWGLCPTEPFYSQETAAFCSGFLVAPDLIVTAGHCIPNQATCDKTKFIFNFRLEASNSQPRSVPTDLVFSCKQLVHSVAIAEGEDFAVARLDRPVTHVAPLAFRTSGAPVAGDPLTVMGHPSGLPLKIAGGANVRAVQAQFLVANLDTYGGNSGSAVFNSATGEVEGVLVRGDMDFKYVNGCRISNVCPSEGCRGEDVTLFERVLPYVQH